MTTPVRFSYRSAGVDASQNSQLAYLSITLSSANHSMTVAGLLDTGSTVNVLPYAVGLRLGLVWEEQTTQVQLTGTLARLPARGVILSGRVDPFSPVDLAFAWTQSEEVPVLLGQINFFLEFNVCFFRSESVFEVAPRNTLRTATVS